MSNVALVHLQHFSSLPNRNSFNSTKIGTRLCKILSLPTLISTRNGVCCPVKCVADITRVPNEKNVERRSGNYQPSIWSFDYVQSISSNYTGEKYEGKIEGLKQEVRNMLEMENDTLALLEQIDVLMRLGLSYHFETEINNVLKGIHEKLCDDKWMRDSLYATALGFRLLREHGFWVPQEVFNAFKEHETGNFRESKSDHDETRGMLSLYEASFHLVKGESILEEARYFSSTYLEKYLKKHKENTIIDIELVVLVDHALDVPLHWRVRRLEARWFIDVYERREGKVSSLLEFAKLDFNIVQSIHQEDLKYTSRWWRRTCLGQKLEFARDRLMENFLWTVGYVIDHKLGYSRRMATEVNALITVIDDIYDLYGTLDELELFTDAVERWNINEIDHLPQYMKVCFVALHNSINEMAFDVLKEQQLHIVKYLQKSWEELCKAYLKEAKWYYSGYKPTLQEYLDHAWVSISGPVMLVHAYFSVANPITEEALIFMENYSSLIRQSSMLLRLADDLGTSSEEMEKGDIPKSIECYMVETGVSEEEAREYIKKLISETWKQLNEDRFESLHYFPKEFIDIAVNLGRMAQCVYQHGDGHSGQGHEIRDRVLSLLVNPIP